MAGYATADQAFVTVNNEYYKLTFDVITGVDNFEVNVDGFLGGNSYLDEECEIAGAYTFYFTALSQTTWIRFRHDAVANLGEIDNVTCQQVEYLPGQRTVYIEVDPDVQSDGLASQTVLDAARVSITTDPDTGISRQPLGLTDDTLWLESIYRTGFHVLITNLDVDSDQEAACKTSISTEVEAYFRSIQPFIDGLDPPAIKNDVITKTVLGRVVDDVAVYYGASVDNVRFGSKPGQFLTQVTMNMGETAKTQSLAYE